MLVNLKEYHKPTELAEAVALLRRKGVVTDVLAGGTELVGRGDGVLDAVVDISGLGLNYIRAGEGWLAIGAMTRLRALEHDPAVQGLAGGLLGRASRQSAPATIRAASTLGGTIVGRKGGIEVPTALLALNATVTYATPELQSLPLDEFLHKRLDLTEGALITEINLPLSPHARGGFAFVSRSPADRAIVCAASVAANGRTRTALGGVAMVPRLVTDHLRHIDHWDVISSFRASAEYRRWVAPVLVRRAWREAMGGTQE